MVTIQNQKQQHWWYSWYIGCPEILFIQITDTRFATNQPHGAAPSPTLSQYFTQFNVALTFVSVVSGQQFKSLTMLERRTFIAISQ
jgi:hypothetical protein